LGNGCFKKCGVKKKPLFLKERFWEKLGGLTIFREKKGGLWTGEKVFWENGFLETFF